MDAVAKAAFARGEFATAGQLYRSLLLVRPAPAAALRCAWAMARADCLLRMPGRPLQEAEGACRDAIHAQPDNAAAHEVLATVLGRIVDENAWAFDDLDKEAWVMGLERIDEEVCYFFFTVSFSLLEKVQGGIICIFLCFFSLSREGHRVGARVRGGAWDGGRGAAATAQPRAGARSGRAHSMLERQEGRSGGRSHSAASQPSQLLAAPADSVRVNFCGCMASTLAFFLLKRVLSLRTVF
jgi:hypothetical protein